MGSFYSERELEQLGLKHFGNNVLISRNASIYSAENIEIGSNVRIDDFCIISGSITIGNYIHISAHTSIFAGEKKVEIKDFCTISSRCAIYSKSDDYSGEYMTNPMIPEKYINVIEKEVILNEYVIVGSGSTILPGVNIGEGASIGSMSLVNKSLEPWRIYVGIPCRYLKDRSKGLLEKKKEFFSEL